MIWACFLQIYITELDKASRSIRKTKYKKERGGRDQSAWRRFSNSSVFASISASSFAASDVAVAMAGLAIVLVAVPAELITPDVNSVMTFSTSRSASASMPSS